MAVCPFMTRGMLEINDDDSTSTILVRVECIGEECAAWTTMGGGYCFKIWGSE